MSRVGWLVLGMVIVLALGIGIGRSCYREPTKAEKRADWILAEDTTFKRVRAQRDSAIQAGIAETRKLKAEAAKWKDSTQTLLQAVDAQARSAATLADLPSGISSHDSIVGLTTALEAQAKVAARLRSEVVPALQKVIQLGEFTIQTQDATIADQQLSLRDEYRRNDQLTEALRNLREETKHEGTINVLGLHIPRCVVPTTVGATGGGVIDSDKPLRGALIGGASGLIGCLIS
jgi:hypothetical protein